MFNFQLLNMIQYFSSHSSAEYGTHGHSTVTRSAVFSVPASRQPHPRFAYNLLLLVESTIIVAPLGPRSQTSCDCEMPVPLRRHRHAPEMY